MSRHTCHAARCVTTVPRRMLMCAKHWRMVPKRLQTAVWDTYTPGQENSVGLVTSEYLAASQRAIAAVAEKEGLHEDAVLHARRADSLHHDEGTDNQQGALL